MTSIPLHPTPRTRAIAIEQFHAVGVALRNEAIFFVGALCVFGVIITAAAVRFTQTPHGPDAHMGFQYSAAAAIPMFLVGLLIPFGVWRSEDPSRRSYHWSMPVARGPHTVMKLVSGWVWLMIATAVYIVFIVGIANLIGLITGEPGRQGSVPAWEWLIAFTAPTLGYLLTSVPVVGSDHPWRWIGGVVVGYGILIAMLRSLGMIELAAALNTISNGRYGLDAALFGSAHDGARGVTIGLTREAMAALRMSTWMIAMPIWTTASAIAAVAASYRHRE
jgi:hypothetical protein